MLLAMATVCARFLSFLRESALAVKFGASAETDAFIVASSIPMLLFGSLQMAISTTIVPVLGPLVAVGDWYGARSVWRSVWGATWFVGLVGAGLMFTCTSTLVRLGAPGLETVTYLMAVDMTRVLAPTSVLLSVAGPMTGALHSGARFSNPALAGLVSNGIVVVTILLLAASIGISAASVGMLLGALLNVILQWPAVIRMGFPLAPTFRWNPSLTSATFLTGQFLLSSIAAQLIFVVPRLFASWLPPGSITHLGFALRLVTFPVGVIGSALGTAMLPVLVEQSAQDNAKFASTIRRGLQQALLVTVGLCVGTVGLSGPIVGFLFERGAFQREDTSATALVLATSAFSMVGSCLGEISGRALLVQKRGKIQLVSTVVGLLVNAGVGYLLVKPLRLAGLGIALSIGQMVYLLIQIIALQDGLGKLPITLEKVFIARVVVAGALMGGVIWVSRLLLAETANIFQVLVCGGAGFLSYIAANILFQHAERQTTLQFLRKAFRLEKLG